MSVDSCELLFDVWESMFVCVCVCVCVCMSKAALGQSEPGICVNEFRVQCDEGDTLVRALVSSWEPSIIHRQCLLNTQHI